MADHEKNSTQAQFVLSYELLLLLRWIVDHDEEKLRKIITKACQAGLTQQLEKANHLAHQQSAQEVQESIIDFFGMLESLLATAAQNQARVRAQQKNLIPAIDKVDVQGCDDAMVQHSLEMATTKGEHDPDTDPRDVLFEELLRRWKPPYGKIAVN